MKPEHVSESLTKLTDGELLLMNKHRKWFLEMGFATGKDAVKTVKCSVTQSCPALWDSMDCSTPDFPVFTISWSLLKLMSIESMMPSNHLILCARFSSCP